MSIEEALAAYPPMPKFLVPLMETFIPLKIDPWSQEKLTAEQRAALASNIAICKAAIVFFTGCGAASGYGGHTGGAYDTVPEVMILDAFFRARPEKFVPIFFDEAGHRVATQYLMATIRGHLPAEELIYYRCGDKKLPGHPELGLTPGVEFSSGRLGHMWSFVNGVQMAHPDKICVMLGSDGAQQEGDDAEAARLCVAQDLPVKLFLDDNDVTIAGHPSEYLKGYSVSGTMKGHGVPFVLEVDGEDLDSLYNAVRKSIVCPGPSAVVMKRKMATGIPGVEGSPHGHDATPVKYSTVYLESHGFKEASDYIKAIKKGSYSYDYQGAGKWIAARKVFGGAVNAVLAKLSDAERLDRFKAIDCDLEGSTGLQPIREAYPDCYVKGGIMERGNLSAAAGFGMAPHRQGMVSTFAAFLEMCISEITMARLNFSNLYAHFTHSGVDDMADNTCHFGINNMFADNGLSDAYQTGLYFPGDATQMVSLVTETVLKPGMHFLFSNRSAVPTLLKENGEPFYGGNYK
jgi:transketolase